MGMDVCGKNASSEKGEYFRNNVWWWHPLWEYCEQISDGLIPRNNPGHYNDGWGLNEEDSKKLAAILQAEIDSGGVALHAENRQRELGGMPDETCVHCSGTGKRDDQFVRGTCNGCKGEGRVRPFSTWYNFTVKNVQKFADFLSDCGGFEIW